MSSKQKKTVTLSVTVGEREMEMLQKIMKQQGFLSLSEAVRAVIRHYYETVVQKCKE
jgi:metal-responsive CopG/Arc/MetJ family transcriptional regulator